MIDSYDVSVLGWPEGHANRDAAVEILGEKNPNEVLFSSWAALDRPCQHPILRYYICNSLQCLRQRRPAADALSRPQAASSHDQQCVVCNGQRSIALQHIMGTAIDLLLPRGVVKTQP